jgi:hypothetical protein
MKKVSKASTKSAGKALVTQAVKAAGKAKRTTKAAPVAAKKAARKPASKASQASGAVWLPDGLHAYAEALQASGLLTGSVGKQRLAEDVDALFSALHAVLAGGVLSRNVKVKGAINERAKGKLDRLAKGLVRELNAFRLGAPENVKYG